MNDMPWPTEAAMTLREKEMYDALAQIAARDCTGLCGLIAQKAIDKMLIEDADRMIRRNEQAIEVFEKVFGK